MECRASVIQESMRGKAWSPLTSGVTLFPWISGCRVSFSVIRLNCTKPFFSIQPDSCSIKEGDTTASLSGRGTICLSAKRSLARRFIRFTPNIQYRQTPRTGANQTRPSQPAAALVFRFFKRICTAVARITQKVASVTRYGQVVLKNSVTFMDQFWFHVVNCNIFFLTLAYVRQK